MAQPGPAPKPTALRILHGDRPGRINRKEPLPPAGEIRCPSHLPAQAKRTWRRLAPDLIRTGVLTPWDVDLFARFCWLEAHTRDLMAAIDRDGFLVEGHRGVVTKHPAAQVLRDSTTEMLSIASRFGLTPSDRSKLSIDRSKKSEGAEQLLSS